MVGNISRILIIVAIMASVVLLFGCQTMTPNKAGYATTESLYTASEQVDLAHERGYITDEEENLLINRLIDGQKVLYGLYAPDEVAGCSAGQTKQECLQIVLNEIEKRLREKQQ